jgi:hypothetical protein
MLLQYSNDAPSYGRVITQGRMNRRLAMNRLQCGLLCLPLLLPAVLFGCGRDETQLPRASVSGIVTYQGKPLASARIIFQHTSGQAAAANLAPDGHFTLSAFQGNNQVAITCTDLAQPNLRQDGRGGEASVKSRIPNRYGEFGASGLTLDVKAEENDNVEFSLKDRPSG